MLNLSNIFKIFLVVCLFVFSGCGLFRNIKKTKTKTTEIINIDTTISILPNKQTEKIFTLENLLNFDTLKIQTERNEISVILENVPRGTILTPITNGTVKVINKEREFKTPVKIQSEVTKTETVKEKTGLTIDKQIVGFLLFLFLLFLIFKIIK